MNSVIAQIVELSGPLPRPERFRAYLGTLSNQQLFDKLEALKADAARTREPGHAPARYHRRHLKIYARRRETVPA